MGYGWSSQLCASYNHFGEEHGRTVIGTGSTSWISCCRKEDRAFRLHPYEGELLRPAALMIHSLGVTDVVILQRGDSWGDFVSEGFSEEFAELGGRNASVIRYRSEIWSEPGSTGGSSGHSWRMQNSRSRLSLKRRERKKSPSSRRVSMK